MLEADDTRISLPNAAVDVILCFDVVEHIMAYKHVFREWRRVLAPHGRVLIWWSVWWHPYGHHLQTMIPLPWVHRFMSDDSMLRVAARIYDTPEFKPRFWHFDDNNQRVPNPYRDAPFSNINKLTIRQFDRSVAEAGPSIVRKEVMPFNGRAALAKRLLAHSPVRDFFCSCVDSDADSRTSGSAMSANSSSIDGTCGIPAAPDAPAIGVACAPAAVTSPATIADMMFLLVDLVSGLRS